MHACTDAYVAYVVVVVYARPPSLAFLNAAACARGAIEPPRRRRERVPHLLGRVGKPEQVIEIEQRGGASRISSPAPSPRVLASASWMLIPVPAPPERSRRSGPPSSATAPAPTTSPSDATSSSCTHGGAPLVSD